MDPSIFDLRHGGLVTKRDYGSYCIARDYILSVCLCGNCCKALLLKESVRRPFSLRQSFFWFVFFFRRSVSYPVAIAGCALLLRNRTSRFRFCATAAR
jgi:hypothetical protein